MRNKCDLEYLVDQKARLPGFALGIEPLFELLCLSCKASKERVAKARPHEVEKTPSITEVFSLNGVTPKQSFPYKKPKTAF